MEFYLDLKLTGLTEKQAEVATLVRIVEAPDGHAVLVEAEEQEAASS